MRPTVALAALTLLACASPSAPPKAAAITIPSAAPSAAESAAAPVATAAPASTGGWDAALARLRPISVRARFPDLGDAPRAVPRAGPPRLDKVRAAVERATADMLVRYVANGSHASLPDMDDAGHYNQIDFLSVTPTAEPLAKYGKARLSYDANDAIVLTLDKNEDASPTALPDQTPALVWEVTDEWLVFVAFDGGAYQLAKGDRAALEPGAGPPSSWPKPLADIEVFGATTPDSPGVATQAGYARARKDFAACVARVGPGVKKKLADKSYAKGSEIAAWVAEGQGDLWITAVFFQRGCKKEILAWGTAVAGAIEERRQDRLAIFDAFKARVASLGAAK